MIRGKLGLAMAAFVLCVISGCGLRERPLLSRRGQCPEQQNCPCPPYMNGYGMEGYGATAMPCSMPGGGGAWPGAVMPGPGIPGPMMPGPMMPNGSPEILQPQQPGIPLPLPNPGNGTPSGPATPKPADPSDGASLKKGNGLAATK